ncbi:hypothetical protein PVAND_014472 [Polypedilum vanderplanki]|uniref:SSD domain-containing protein n=1 Tax=Polypedilum vanderplanki TaxID=319348 RepID=A0A9J6B9H7_POLVA|nr:hypothetical protein PVAND_014472 [Polypedilum vanderplanki]
MGLPINDSIPRVPEPHSELTIEDEKLYSDLYIRTSWFDAALALDQIEKGKADGRRTSIYLRHLFQSHFFKIGRSIDKHAGIIIFMAALILGTFCVGLKSVIIHSNVNQLWLEVGGSLEQELAYTDKYLGYIDTSTNNQLLIQTLKNEDATILYDQALLSHLKVVKQALGVEVFIGEVTWTLKDLCQLPSSPRFDEHFMEQILEIVIPCAIITPLDCFWEGSKLLGPDRDPHIPMINEKYGTISWQSLDPARLLEDASKSFHTEDKSSKSDQGMIAKVEQYMKQAGITTGYIKKPCLNPFDPQCPASSPNKRSRQTPDIGAALSGGCYGYAMNFMHWPEELIVGGAEKNATNHIKKAKALQTVIQLMSEQELYDHWHDNYKTHYAGWSLKKAKEVLNAWQEKFSNEVRKIMREEGNTTYSAYDFNAFSSTTLNNSLRAHSKPDFLHLSICVIIIMVYTGLVLYRFGDPVNGQSGVGMFGILLLCASTAAGLGVCSLLGLAFNVSTTQVVPLIALGLAVDQIFILTHGYDSRRNSNEQMHTAQIMKKYGLSVLFNGASTASAFLGAALLPIPILRTFALQATILITVNLFAILFVFPAFITLDLRRRRSSHMDIFCCLPTFTKVHHPIETVNNDSLLNKPKKCQKLTIKLYIDLILNGKMKALGIFTILVIFVCSTYATIKLQDGFELTDLIPKNTSEHNFISAQSNLFGFYNIYAVTQGNFEYPQNQKLLREYHEAFIRVPYIIKNDNGGLPDFWLNQFRDWLKNLQNAFDRDYKSGAISKERWYANASADGILAFKLLAQTGHVDNPIDKSLITHNRLVNSDGIINPKAFYNYLSAWAWNDAAYGASQSNLRPSPRMWIHSPKDKHMEIPKSAPLSYTQLPFYLHGLYTTKDIKNVIEEIRELCTKFNARGLPNYPSGIPFLYWAQYFNLHVLIGLALAGSILVTFVLSIIFLQSVSASILVILNAIFVFAQLFGVMLVLDVKLSAIAAVILIASIGLSICFTANITLGFLTSIGNRERRLRLALEHTIPYILHSITTSILILLILYFSPFEFIVKHFFYLLISFWLVCAVNSLFHFPMLLLLFGMRPELVPYQHQNRISTPSPQLKSINSSKSSGKAITLHNKRTCRKKSHHCHVKNTNLNNEQSLTTITEEPSWQSSASSLSNASGYISDGNKSNRNFTRVHNNTKQDNSNTANVNSINIDAATAAAQQAFKSIIVQPEVTVETHHNGNQQNTKVTATANIKLEFTTGGSGSGSDSDVKKENC